MSELDLAGLDDIFQDEQGEGIEPRKKRLTIDYGNDNIDYNDPLDVIKNNIKRANAILDAIQSEMEQGNFTARMVEVAGNLVNSITAASKEVITNTNYQGYLTIKEDLVKLKAREIDLKEQKIQKPLNQNIILTSRDDLLKLLGKKREIAEIKEIENKPEKETK
jgi:hypothetical protein